MGVDAIEAYPQAFTDHYVELMAAKLGLEPEQDVADILISLLNLLAKTGRTTPSFFVSSVIST